MELGKWLDWLKGFKNDFMRTDIYNDEFFSKVILLKDVKHWDKINKLMKREFMWEWDKFIGKDAGIHNRKAVVSPE